MPGNESDDTDLIAAASKFCQLEKDTVVNLNLYPFTDICGCSRMKL
jgi:hypothetical protein